MSPARVAVKRPAQASNSASGISVVSGRVLSVQGNIAQVRLSTMNRVEPVRADILPGKSAAPVAGELWLLDQRLGQGWYFTAVVNYPGLDDIEWIRPVLFPSWDDTSSGPWSESNGAYAPVGFSRDGMGWVTLRGTATGPTNNSSAPGPVNSDILQLPDGYRPSRAGQLRFGVMSGNNATGAVVVRPDGFVRAVAGSNQSVSLDGIRFLAVPARDYNVQFEPLVTLTARGEPLAL